MAKQRGQPPKTEIERLQAKLWFTTVSMQSGMDANQLERFFRTQLGLKNEGDEGAAHSWAKYASGKRLPRDSRSNSRSAVPFADKAFPGTAQWIRSPFWRLLKNPELNAQQIVELILQTKNHGIYNLFIRDENCIVPSRALVITLENWKCLAQIASFDAFGVMLAYCRFSRGQDDAFYSMRIKDCRKWLHYAYSYFPTIKNHRDELVGVLQKFAPELGDLNYLGKEAPDRDQFAESLMASLGF